MTLVSLVEIERHFGEHVVLEGAGLRVDEHDRIGVIGDNGAGKTTLIKILAGTEEPDRGQRLPRRGLRIAYLAQIPKLEAGVAVHEYVLRGNGEFQQLERRIQELAQALEQRPEDAQLLDEYGHLQAAFEAGGGYDRTHVCERVLNGIGFAEADWGKDVAVLSGGEKTRLVLCALMTSPAELLILDEPTNHLDLEGIAFLEEYVVRYPGAVVAISHDRRFLDAVATQIVEVEGGTTRTYKGNWSAYVKQRDTNLLAQARAFKDQQEYIDKEMEYIRRNMAGRMSVQAKGRLKRLQRLELIARPKHARHGMRLRFAGGRGHAGQPVLEIENLALRLPGGRTLLERATFRLYHGEVLGILGRNGAGKSTLLRCLAGLAPPSAGEVRRAHGVRAGFFSQEMQDLPRHGTILEALRAADPQALDKDLRDHLGLFLFTGDDAERPVEGLSGGEKRRLCLARLTRGHYDFLCLDEPTNHLDITAREAFEAALQEYAGAVLVVSHDRAFLAELVDRVLYVADARVRVFDGGLEQCFATLAEERAASRQRTSEQKEKERRDAAPPPAVAAPPGRIRNPQAFSKLEEKIMALEEELDTLRRQMEVPDNYASRDKMQQLLARETQVRQELQEAYARWENWQ